MGRVTSLGSARVRARARARVGLGLGLGLAARAYRRLYCITPCETC